MELQSRVDELRNRGLDLATISYDPPEPIAAFGRQHGITFPTLSDEGSATIKRYGILNPVPEQTFGPNRNDPSVKADVEKYVSVVNPSIRMVGIAFPGTFILDPQGVVTSRFFEEFYIERNTVSGLTLKLGAGTAPMSAVKASSPHLSVTTYASDAGVAPGNRFALALDIVPRRGIHVYAPGASDYRVITLRLADQPAVRLLPVEYPASEIYFFESLNERMPVYQESFTLVQEVILEGTPEARSALRGKNSLTLSGSLEYQACDDNLCFNPVSLPVSWTFTLRPLVSSRP